MKQIRIKKKYYERTKEILRKIKPYTYFIDNYFIIFEIDNEKSNCFIKWFENEKEYKINIPIVNFKDNCIDKLLNNCFFSDELNEIIESLTESNKTIYFKIENMQDKQEQN